MLEEWDTLFLEDSSFPQESRHVLETLSDHEDQQLYLADALREDLDKGHVVIDDKLRCPLTLGGATFRGDNPSEAEKRSNMFANRDHVELCKGKANGFKSVSALYQHARSVAAHSSKIHQGLVEYIESTWPKEIAELLAKPEKLRKQMHRAKALDSEAISDLAEFKNTFLRLRALENNHGQIAWPPLVMLEGLTEAFSSKSALAQHCLLRNASKVILLFSRFGFQGSALILFPGTVLGYESALRLESDASRATLCKQALVVESKTQLKYIYRFKSCSKEIGKMELKTIQDCIGKICKEAVDKGMEQYDKSLQEYLKLWIPKKYDPELFNIEFKNFELVSSRIKKLYSPPVVQARYLSFSIPNEDLVENFRAVFRVSSHHIDRKRSRDNDFITVYYVFEQGLESFFLATNFANRLNTRGRVDIKWPRVDAKVLMPLEDSSEQPLSFLPVEIAVNNFSYFWKAAENEHARREQIKKEEQEQDIEFYEDDDEEDIEFYEDD